MGIKKAAAKPLLGFRRFWQEGNEQTNGVGTFVLSAMFGAAAGMISVPVQDMVRPVEDTPLAGQEEALQQYGTVLSTLAAQRTELNTTKDTTQPGALSDLLGVEDNASAHPHADQELEQTYHNQLNKFATAIMVDERLNEADIQNLLTRFEATHGNISEITDFEQPDYNDINESRERAKWLTHEKERAAHIINISNHTDGNVLLPGIGFFLLPWVLFFGASAGRSRLEDWEKGKKAPRKSGFNH